jgi:DNA-binding response OmpR family regulator
LRQRRSSNKVLVLTARDAVEDRVLGLNLGADDYMTKPFLVNEFEARVRALLRRNVAPSARVVGEMAVDFAARRVRVRDRAVDLTSWEWALLELFLTHPGRALSKDQIAERLSSVNEPLSPNAIEAHVSQLRTKLEPAGAYIRTVRGFGYLWESADG